MHPGRSSMARAQYYAAIPDGSDWTTPFAKAFRMDIHSGDFAEFVPVDASNFTITFAGKGFVYDADSDFIEGTVTSVTFTTGSNDYFKLSGLSLSATQAQDLAEDIPLLIIVQQLTGKDRILGSSGADSLEGLNGNDALFGKAGNDELDGGLGQNILTGGKGFDIFDCKISDGDTITDFDAKGGIGKQDFIDINGTVFDVERSGGNTIVTVQGDEILLIGIKPKEIDAGDFI
jgi:Ca2+-binding RTX toxin-like protein